MKKVFIVLVSLFAMMAASTGLKAQEVTILLRPGWNWIGYPFAESIDLEVAFGDFVPMNDDVIQSFWGYSEYATGFGWFGGIDELRPGWGYMYYSNRTEPVNIVLGTPIDLPTVTTSSATNITTYGLTCGGEVTDSGNSGVLVRGVCWSTQQNPTVNDPHTTDGYGMGSFSSAVEGLEMNTTYYVRAYAMTTSGTGYGEQIMLSTKNGVPTLTTSAASEIGTTWATCGGDISDDGGMEVTERGICWSTSPNPTIEGNHGSNGAGLGSFSVNMNNLEPNTTYYVRAYATNGYTTAYGNEIFFRTEVTQTWPNGKLSGQFSVRELHKVQFSQGNLQYIGSAATPYWRFAEHQWDCLGSVQNGAGQYIDRDLFGWGTSGWDNGNMFYQPYDTEQFWDSNTGYGYGPTDGTNYNYRLTGLYENADWGVNNAILNGGNQTNQWRTLTGDEWKYLLNTRITASGIRYAKAQVYGVNGVVILPDDWETSLYTLNYPNNAQAPFNSNIISDSDWATLETNGVVFLPAAGCRYSETSFSNVGSGGYYWSASCEGNSNAYSTQFNNSSLYPKNYNSRYYGQSVRLVCNVSIQYTYVDLGLPSGTLWAICNLGANAPEEYGDYLAWGEIIPKTTYSWGTYQYCHYVANYTYHLTKYCNKSEYGYNGFTDSLTILLPEDDAATWGNEWRIPTKEEWQELYQNTTQTWTTQNGVNGRLFTASNGSTIFLPATGGLTDNVYYFSPGSEGGYWSSSLSLNYPSKAWCFDFGSYQYGINERSRNTGFSVRPVRSSTQN